MKESHINTLGNAKVCGRQSQSPVEELWREYIY